LFKCVFNIGPHAVNILQAPGCLNPALYHTVAHHCINYTKIH